MALKLIALDDQDLSIVSAHVQDAVMKVSDLEFLPAAKRFVLTMNRFVWEAKSGLFRQHNERRQAVLHFDRVLGAKTNGIARDKPAEVLSLLASATTIRMSATSSPLARPLLFFFREPDPPFPSSSESATAEYKL